MGAGGSSSASMSALSLPAVGAAPPEDAVGAEASSICGMDDKQPQCAKG